MGTVAANFTFDSDSQGWSGTNPAMGAGMSASWDGSTGNPAGSLQFALAPGFSSDTSSAWFLATTWEDLGVPGDATVTGVSLAIDDRIVAAGSGVALGAHKLTDTAGGSTGPIAVGNNTIATLLAARSSSSDEASWTSRSGSTQAVGSPYQSPSQSIQVLLWATLNTGGAGTAAQANFDNVALTVTYSETVVTYNGSGSVDVDHPTLAGTGSPSLPLYAGSSGPTIGHPTAGGSASFAPNPHGSGSPSARHSMAGSGTSTRPDYAGSLAATVDHPLLAGHATEGWAFHGSGSLSRHPTISSPGNRTTTTTSGSATLAMTGSSHPSWAGSMTMAVPGVDPGALSLWATLAVDGTLHDGVSAMMGLRLESDYGAAHGRTTLAVSGSTGTVVDDGPAPDLFVEGWSAPSSAHLGLVVANDDPPPGTSALMNLTIPGGNATADGVATLALANGWSAPSGDVDLYVAGLGMFPGYYPTDESMGLYLARGPEAGMALFLAQSQAEGTATLFVAGMPLAEGSSTLWVGGQGGVPSGRATLAIPEVMGPGTADLQADLAIPSVLGGQSARSMLFVGGWDGGF